jgi:hypothetical protein
VFTRTLNCSLSWPGSIHSIYLRSILISSFHLSSFLPVAYFLLVFPPKLYLQSSLMPATCHPNLIPFHLIILILLGEGYKLWSSSLRSFLQPSVTLSLFVPNILFSVLFLNTLCIPSLTSETKFQAHTKPQAKRAIVLHILNFTFLDSRRKDERFWIVR